MTKPYIEVKGKKYEFELTRRLLVEFSNETKGRSAGDFGLDFLENLCFKMLERKYNLSREDFDAILDGYCDEVGNCTEIYELLGAIVDTVFTSQERTESKNKFLSEYRKNQSTKQHNLQT